MSNKIGFHHEILKNPAPVMQGSGGLFEKIKHENPEYIIEQGKNWAIVMKQGPYSDRDFMILYKGERDIGNILALAPDEQHEFEAMMEKYAQFIHTQVESELRSGKTSLASGMNLAPIPSQKTSQTVKVPHFHFSLMRNEDFSENGIKVSEFEIDTHSPNHRKKLAIRESSTILTEYLANQMKQSMVARIAPTTFAVELPDQLNFASRDNIAAFQEIQKEVWEFLTSGYQKVPGISIEDHETLGATFAITYDPDLQKYVVCCRVIEKEHGSGAGVLETLHYTISRAENILNLPVGDQAYYNALKKQK